MKRAASGPIFAAHPDSYLDTDECGNPRMVLVAPLADVTRAAGQAEAPEAAEPDFRIGAVSGIGGAGPLRFAVGDGRTGHLVHVDDRAPTCATHGAACPAAAYVATVLEGLR